MEGLAKFLRSMLLGTSALVSFLLSRWVRSHTKQNVWDEEDAENDVPLNARETEVGVEAFYLRIADIGSVQMTDQIEDCKHGNQANVDLYAS
jgi:hypothetical protein